MPYAEAYKEPSCIHFTAFAKLLSAMHLLAYIKTKPAHDGLRAQKTWKNRRAYREQHEKRKENVRKLQNPEDTTATAADKMMKVLEAEIRAGQNTLHTA